MARCCCTEYHITPAPNGRIILRHDAQSAQDVEGTGIQYYCIDPLMRKYQIAHKKLGLKSWKNPKSRNALQSSIDTRQIIRKLAS